MTETNGQWAAFSPDGQLVAWASTDSTVKVWHRPSGEVVTVSIKIESQERIRVPAGDFNSWKVRVETPANTVFIWVDDAAPHRMLRASAEQREL